MKMLRLYVFCLFIRIFNTDVLNLNLEASFLTELLGRVV